MMTIQSMTYESNNLFEMRDSDLGPERGLVAILAVNRYSNRSRCGGKGVKLEL